MLSDILKRQLSAESLIPKYNYHISDSIISLDDERVMCVLSAKGTPFEVISDNILENNYDSLNSTLLSIAKSTGSRLAIWCYLDHFQTRFEEDYDFNLEWLKSFSEKYMEKFKSKAILENCFYMAFILKPSANDDLEECKKELEDIQQTVIQSLRSYECDILKTYEYKGNLFSEVYEFLGYLNNGFWERIPVTSLPLYQTIQSSQLHHSYKIIETRFPDGKNKFSALFDLKDFPEITRRGIFNPILELPFPFIMCYSFTFIDTATSLKMLTKSLNVLQSAGDEAIEQQEEIANGKGALMSGDIYFGEFHSALMVHGKTPKEAEDRGATARITLSANCASIYTPATISAPETFYSFFPGNIKHRPRPMPKTTRNLTGLFSMNSFSSGKHYGNPIGDGHAIIPLQTSVHGVYHFNFHYSLEHTDNIGEKRAGHTVIVGATGVGKTTLQTTLICFLERFNCKVFAIDKDGSMRGMVEALNGTYFKLESGQPTGLNPFQLPKTQKNLNFLYDLVTACGKTGNQDLTAEDTKDIKRAVDTVYEMPFETRRLGLILQSIPDRGENCLSRRLSSWCYGETTGRYAFALDNPKNLFDWETFWRIGFDVTDFLKAGLATTEPILSYLFHLKSLMQEKGGLLATVVEEFWLPISYQTTADQILDSLKTGRRRDEFVILVTQSPEDAIKSPLLPAILQQTPTKIYLANPDAEYAPPGGGGYVRFGLTIKEFQKLKKLGLQDYKFLVKQGSQSCIAKMNLSNQVEDISVLAMTPEDFPFLEQAKEQAGNHPDDWVPLYKKLRKEGRVKLVAPPQERS